MILIKNSTVKKNLTCKNKKEGCSMKKEIQDHVILKNKGYSFLKEDGEKVEGLVTDISFINSMSENDFNIVIEFDNKNTQTFHSNEIVDIVERDLNPSV